MSLVGEILRTYRAPRDSVRRLLEASARDDRSEARALMHLLLGCFILFVSAIPAAQAGGAAWHPDASAEMRVSSTFFAWMFLAPLLFYGAAAFGHLTARLIGGRGSFARARFATFWCVLCIAPLVLIAGMIGQIAGVEPVQVALGLLTLLLFLGLWALSLFEAERPQIV